MSSELDIQRKSATHFVIGAAIVFTIITLLFLIPSHLYSYLYYHRAGAGWHIVGYIMFFGNYNLLWKCYKYAKDAGETGRLIILCIALFFLSLLVFSGFNFMLP